MQSRSVIVGLVVALCLSAASRATVLTFDFGGDNLFPVPSTYGDHVGNPGFPQNPAFMYGPDGGPTPNVGIIYTPILRLAAGDPMRVFGDLSNVLYRDRLPGNDPGIMQFMLIADPGFQVSLFSFDMAAMFNSVTGAGEDLPLKSIKIFDHDGLPLYSLDYDPAVLDHESLLSTYVPGTLPLRHKRWSWEGAPLTSTSLTIRIDLTQLITIGGTKVDRVGIDNIKFGQGIAFPTPSTAALLSCGLLTLARRRRPV